MRTDRPTGGREGAGRRAGRGTARTAVRRAGGAAPWVSHPRTDANEDPPRRASSPRRAAAPGSDEARAATLADGTPALVHVCHAASVPRARSAPAELATHFPPVCTCSLQRIERVLAAIVEAILFEQHSVVVIVVL